MKKRILLIIKSKKIIRYEIIEDNFFKTLLN